MEKKSEEEIEEIFKKTKEDLNKKIMYNILIIESLIKKDRKMKAFVDKIKKTFPIVEESKTY